MAPEDREAEAARLRRHLEVRSAEVEAQVALLRRQLEGESDELARRAAELEERGALEARDRTSLVGHRTHPDDARE